MNYNILEHVILAIIDYIQHDLRLPASKFLPLIANPTFSFSRYPPLAQPMTPTQTFSRYETQLLYICYCSFQADQKIKTVFQH